jgi:3-oxoacyl-[acyl-carrier protein] reductase
LNSNLLYTHKDRAALGLDSMENRIALGRLPTLDEVANAAVFMASDRASAMTGTIANLTCGSIID